jgi:mannose-6-phosphate isomerase-like protein (cupin superfamily)
MTMSFSRWNPTVDGRLTEAALRRKLERLGYSVTRYVYPPGAYFPNHSHGVDKMDAVVSGRFRMVLAGREVVLEAGDMQAVPAGVIHSAAVMSNEPVVSLDGVKM